MSEQQQNTIVRFGIIFLLIFAGFVVVVVKIASIQYFERSTWQKIEAKQGQIQEVVPPTRGNIMDCHGKLLAGSVPLYDVYMDTRVEALHLGGDTLFHKYLDSIAEGMSAIVGDTTPQGYRARITKAFYNRDRKRRDVRICKRRVNYIEMKRIKELPLVSRGYYKSGFHFEDRHLRSKPYGTLGGRTIGNLYTESGCGYSGLELAFEPYLHGIEGLSRKQKVAGKTQLIPIREAVNGYDIVTTLDAELMDICETALRQRLNLIGGDWGCCILMEAKTGEIKAISNLDRNSDGTYSERENHAVKRVEPGSVFKTITLMAILDDDRFSLTDTVSVTAAPWMYYDSKHRDSHPKDTVYTVRSALAVSSNIAFAKLVTQAYEHKAERYVNKLRRLGICDSLHIEIPGAEAPRIDIPKDRVTLSKMAYGYSVEVSPVQIVSFYNAIANNGKMLQPILVKRIERNGDIVKRFESRTMHAHVCGQRALRDVKLALDDVVWDNQLGTASVRMHKGHIVGQKAQSNIVRIAGKTGTAQLFEKGNYRSDKHRITFVGYFPEEQPEYTCICMINHPATYPYYDAGWDCGRVVKQIAEQTMAYAGEYVLRDGKKVWVKVR